MFDLLVFTQYPNAYAPKRFVEEADKRGLKIKVIGYGDLKTNFNVSDLSLSKYVICREPNARDFIYDLRDNIIKHYLQVGSYVFNSRTYIKWSILDKLLQHRQFKKGSIPHIKPLSLENAKYPFVIKDKLGSHGSHVFKIKSKSDLDNVFVKGYEKKDLLVQEFQESGFDLRAIVLGSSVLGIMKRTPQPGNFLSNFSQGGSVEKYEGSDIEEIKEIAIKTAKHFYLDFCGVDIMRGNDGNWKVLEVNRACQFQGFEKATGINIAASILDFLLSNKKSA